MKAFASLAVLTVFLLVPVASANAEATAIAEAAEAIVDAAALEVCFAEGAGLPPAEGAELPNQSSMFSGGWSASLGRRGGSMHYRHRGHYGRRGGHCLWVGRLPDSCLLHLH